VASAVKRTALAQALRAPTPNRATVTDFCRFETFSLFHSSWNRSASVADAAAVSETSVVLFFGIPATVAASRNARRRRCDHHPGTASAAVAMFDAYDDSCDSCDDASMTRDARVTRDAGVRPTRILSPPEEVGGRRSLASDVARDARLAASSTTIAASVSGRKESKSSESCASGPVSARARASALGNGTLPRPSSASSAPTSDRGSPNTHRGQVDRSVSASAPRTRAACLSVNPTSEGLERPPRSSGTTETSRAEEEREAATVVESAPTSMPSENASDDARHASVAATNTSDAERARAGPPRARARRIAARQARARVGATPRCAWVVMTAASRSHVPYSGFTNRDHR